jgi:hypothetical protein
MSALERDDGCHRAGGLAFESTQYGPGTTAGLGDGFVRGGPVITTGALQSCLSRITNGNNAGAAADPERR